MPLKVLSVASEAVPLVKTGGLADVVGALPGALEPHGVELTTLLPGYPAVMQSLKRARALHTWDSLLGTPARLVAGKLDSGHPLLVLDAPALFIREGAPYADAAGQDWGDNWQRFSALSRAAADIAGGAIVKRGKAQRFDLVHAHDWQAAMTAAYLRFAPFGGEAAVPSIVTIHNMAFQGWFGREVFPRLGLPPAAWSMDAVEYHGGVGMLKAGIACADAVTAVSPTYAREIRSSAFGMGLEGLIVARGNAVHGILNGIDTDLWNPASDPALAACYSHRTIERRIANKRALEAEFGLNEDDSPLFVVISRLTWQKGMDVLLEVLDHLVGIGGRLALLGSGDHLMERGLHEAAARHPGRIGIRIGYNEDLSHLMQGGGDAILLPSRFEPCGLTQLYGLAYGCLPVVSRTGGLADTVIDANPAALAAGCATGVQFDGVTYDALAAALTRTVALYHQHETWARIRKNAMKCDFSWKASGKAYADLYRALTA
ncbi:glycogen synthase GlgA [Novosphingobium mangrovi (ex Huang et al. 2023)]|uniref:Glycogen synthase n=1 Tax=Novosphingobium mangrovi (ex Huang et al. 2023) TaxID=2976432 RepID=A0ABT2I281_9SPHN|nr:glycogen synthase GlgA [Novosphingobium mangrovi (ex Huang et al. 2023)]MCT2398909.1 glycogen synthase GlgA [Novosphingobium mangrovi (ex Huang et al. 2023)]